MSRPFSLNSLILTDNSTITERQVPGLFLHKPHRINQCVQNWGPPSCNNYAPSVCSFQRQAESKIQWVHEGHVFYERRVKTLAVCNGRRGHAATARQRDLLELWVSQPEMSCSFHLVAFGPFILIANKCKAERTGCSYCWSWENILCKERVGLQPSK